MLFLALIFSLALTSFFFFMSFAGMDALQSHQQQNHSQATLVQYAPCPFAANLISILSSSTRTRYILEHASGGNLRSIIRRCRSAWKEKVRKLQVYMISTLICSDFTEIITDFTPNRSDFTAKISDFP